MNLNTLLDNDNFLKSITILTTLISAILTYIGTKYVIMKPKKLEIAEKRLKKIYLPLYQIFFLNTEDVSKEYLLNKKSQIFRILKDNYIYAFPQLQDLINALYLKINNNNDYNKILEKVTYQISIDFNELKKLLGYPSLSYYQIFKRKTRIEKFKTICRILLNLYIYFSFLIFIIYFLNYQDDVSQIPIWTDISFAITIYILVKKFT